MGREGYAVVPIGKVDFCQEWGAKGGISIGQLLEDAREGRTKLHGVRWG